MINTLELSPSDLGNMIFHRGAMGRRGERCFSGLTVHEAPKQYGWFAADAGLMIITHMCSGYYSRIIIREVLFHDQ